MYLISATFRENQVFFKAYGKLFLKTLSRFTHIFVQNAYSNILLAKKNISQVTIAGDTRIDRVYQISKKVKPLPLIKLFCQNNQIFVVGSSWEKDEIIISKFIKEKATKDWKFIFAPHDVSKVNIDRLFNLFDAKNTILYSKLSKEINDQHKILIIDNVGLLSAIYQYGSIAYIGGGFGTGIHNTLEPITFGLPVIFGPNYHKFEEAKALLRNKGGFSISNYDDFVKIMESLENPIHKSDASKNALKYIMKNVGATDIIYSEIPILHF